LSSVSAFEACVRENAVVVLDFHAAWCGPCRFVAPKYAALAERLAASGTFCKVDVDESQELARFAQIRAMPTFQVYKMGKKIFEMTGIDLEKLEAVLVGQHAEGEASCNQSHQRIVPQKAMMRFESGQAVAVVRKVLEFAEELHREEHPRCLSDADMEALRSFGAAAETISGPVFSQGIVLLLARCLDWPHSRLFPVVDAIRLALIDSRHAAMVAQQVDAADCILKSLRMQAMSTEAGEINHMMALRLHCNLLASAPRGALPEGSIRWVAPLLELAAAAQVHAASRRGARLALSTLLLNAAVLLVSYKADCETKTPLICSLQQCLTTPQPDMEVVFRAVLALGTIVHEDDDAAALCVGLDLIDALQQVKATATKADKLYACVAEVVHILQQSASS